MTMGRKDDYQSKMEFIDLNTLVPTNHILRQINEYRLKRQNGEGAKLLPHFVNSPFRQFFFAFFLAGWELYK